MPQNAEARIVALESVHFYRNNSSLSEAALRILDDAALRLQMAPETTLVVDGYSEATERYVSLRRAANARLYLVNEKGIDAGRIAVRFFDDRYQRTDPRENRRVDLYLLSKGVKAFEIARMNGAYLGERPPWSGPVRVDSLVPSARTSPRAVVQTGHTDAVLAVALSPDGHYAVTGGGDATVALWDATTGRQLLRLASHTGPVAAVAFSHDGRLFATASADGTASVWNVATGAEISRYDGHATGMTSASFSPDDSLVVTGASDGTARVWTAAAGTELQRGIPAPGAIETVAFSPDGARFIAAGDDGVARIWSTITGERVAQLVGPESPALAAAILPDGRTAVTAGDDGVVHLWDVAVERETRSFRVASLQLVAMALSPDGRTALVSDGGKMALWDVSEGRIVREIDTSGEVGRCGAFDDSGRTAVAGAGSIARTFDVTNGSPRTELRRLVDGSTGSALSSNARTLAAGLESGSTTVLDVGGSRQLWRLRHDSTITAAEISSDGRYLATLQGWTPSWPSDEIGGTTTIWDMTTGARIFGPDENHRYGPYTFDEEYDLPDCPTAGPADLTQEQWQTWYVLRNATTKQCLRAYHAGNAAISSDGRRVVAAHQDGSILVHQAATGRILRRIQGFFSDIEFVGLGADDRLVVATSMRERSVRAWDVAHGNLEWDFAVPHMEPSDGESEDDGDATYLVVDYGVYASRDGRYVGVAHTGLNGCECPFRLLSAATGVEIWVSTLHDPYYSVDAVSRDGTLRISADGTWEDDKSLHVVQEATPRQKLWSTDERDAVFSPNSRLILTRSDAGALTLREATTGREIWRVELGAANGAFSADGRFVLASGADDGLAILDARSDRMLARLYFFTDGSWIVLDPDGPRYDTPDGKLPSGLIFVTETKPLDANAAQRLREPRLLAKLLGVVSRQ